MIIGCFGRKEKGSDYLGHVATTTLKSANAHIFIIKHREVPLPPINQPATWILATDNSPTAKHALDIVLSLMHPSDHLWIFYAAKFEAFAKRVQTAHESELEKGNRQGTFVFEHVQGRQNYAEAIVEFAEKKGADVLAIGHRGHSKKLEVSSPGGTEQKKLGSVSEYCSENARCALLIVKGTGQHE